MPPLCSTYHRPVTDQLRLWWALSAVFQKLGPAWFRTLLADLVVLLVPNQNLRRMREIVHILDRTTRDIFREKSARGKSAKDFRADAPHDNGIKDLMSILRKLVATH